MLIRNQTRKLDVPEEIAGKPGQFIEVRLLSGPQMDHARDVRTERQTAQAKAAGADFIAKMRAMRAAEGIAPKASTESDYDPDELVNAAFVGSSEGPLVEKEKASDVLDLATRNWLAAEVEKMNVRPLATSPGSAG